MWRNLSVLLMMIAAILLPGCRSSKDKGSAEDEQGYKKIKEQWMTFRWKVDDSQLKVVMKAETTGWIAVGFKPSNGMQDANLIIGYVKDGETFISDDFGTWFSSHEPDENLGGKNDVVIVSGKEENGETEIAFSIPLNSGDEQDQVLKAGETTKVLFAYGTQDDFTTMHKNKFISSIDL